MATLENPRIEKELIGITPDIFLLEHYFIHCLGDRYKEYGHSCKLPKHTQTIHVFAPEPFTSSRPLLQPMWPRQVAGFLMEEANSAKTIYPPLKPANTVKGWTIRMEINEAGVPIVAAEATWVPA